MIASAAELIAIALRCADPNANQLLPPNCQAPQFEDIQVAYLLIRGRMLFHSEFENAL